MIALKDGLKFSGVTVVCFCAVFVCTFFMNFYADVLPLKESVSAEALPLYTAQLATAKMVCGITGGFLSVIAAIMVVFYIRIYVDSHRRALGTFKAMGYSNAKIAASFLVFGASVLTGCALGFGLGWAIMPFIYKELAVEGMAEITPTFHAALPVYLIVAPTAVFTAVGYLYALVTLRKPPLELMRGTKKLKVRARRCRKDRPLLVEMCLSTLSAKKMLAFFVAFSCFCFSAMVQMGASMQSLAEGTMGAMILAIGLVLAAVSMIMAMTSLVRSNAANIAVMRAMGFSAKERFAAVFLCYIPVAVIGFALGTVYQYILLKIMINLVFSDVAEIPEYSFDVPAFFITLAAFAICYAAMFAFFLYKADKATIKETFTE